MQIIDVWEASEAADAFVQQRLIPAFEQAGVLDQVMSEGPPTPHEVFELVH